MTALLVKQHLLISELYCTKDIQFVRITCLSGTFGANSLFVLGTYRGLATSDTISGSTYTGTSRCRFVCAAYTRVGCALSLLRRCF